MLAALHVCVWVGQWWGAVATGATGCGCTGRSAEAGCCWRESVDEAPMVADMGLPEVVVPVACEEWVVVDTVWADAACMLPAPVP